MSGRTVKRNVMAKLQQYRENQLSDGRRPVRRDVRHNNIVFARRLQIDLVKPVKMAPT